MPKIKPKRKRQKQLNLPHVTVRHQGGDYLPNRNGSPILAFRVEEQLLVAAERKFKDRTGVNNACREFLARAVRK